MTNVWVWHVRIPTPRTERRVKGRTKHEIGWDLNLRFGVQRPHIALRIDAN